MDHDLNGVEKRDILANKIEEIIFRRIFEDKVVGYTIEMSLEIADAVLREVGRWR